MNYNSALYIGSVFHRRLRPTEHRLDYKVFSLLLDLDELQRLDSSLRLFSWNRFNLFSIHDKDFGERAGESLFDYANRKLLESGIKHVPHKIYLSCYPRILGYAFNPLSIFYCLDKAGELLAVIHEVHNTFGERHAYVLPVTCDPDAHGFVHQYASKELFVSPFAHMSMSYRFRLNIPSEKQVVVIRASDESGLLITASYTARRQALRTSSLLRRFFSTPMMVFKVLGGIHWEALLLWLKRVPWFSHVPKEKVHVDKRKTR